MPKTKKRLKLNQIKDELARIARIGQEFVDGDLCRQAWEPHSETFMCGDDMDYNPDAGIPLKKTLMRLERLCPFPCGTTLWRRRPDFPDTGEVLLFGMHSSPQGGDKPPRGYVPPKMTKELQAVFLRGEGAWRRDAKNGRTAILIDRGVEVAGVGVKNPFSLQLFVPVKDSMGDTAAALEVFTVVT
jgi:hypothetical protein